MAIDLQSLGEQYLPQIKVFGTTFVSTIAWLIILLIALAFLGVIAFVIVNRKNYKYNLILFENINGRWVDTGKDKAMEIKFGDLGSRILYAKNHKKYLPFPQIQSGTRKYYYKIRGDGQWENFELHFDDSPASVRGVVIEKDMRYANVGIRKGLKERYDKPTFWGQYGTVIISIAFITIIGVLTWLLFDKWITLAQTTSGAMDTANKVMQTQNDILGKLDNLLTQKGYVTR